MSLHPAVRRLSLLVPLTAVAASSVCLAETPATQPSVPEDVAARLDPDITPEELLADVAYLADEAREGRGIGTGGLEDSAEYIAQQFDRLGLKQIDAEDFDGYFQTFTVPTGLAYDDEETVLNAGDLELVPGEDFIPYGWSSSDPFEGELVFAGYGVTSPANDYDDYANLDVEGKVVLVLRYEPHDEEGGSRITGRDRYSPAAQFMRKARLAEEAGAAALLIVNPPEHGPEEDTLPEMRGGGRNRDLPVYQVTQEAAGRMLAAAGLPDLETLQEQIDENFEPASQAGNGLRVSGQWEAEVATAEVRNVVALLPGEKADEYVVIGGHYDHVGSGEYGSSQPGHIHNGADDNASGTAAVLEVAEALALRAQAGERPERSIIFALFTAEEVGLVGSEHLVENFPVPLENVVGMINLDMVGRIRDDELHVGGRQTAPAFAQMVDQAVANTPLSVQDIGSGLDGRSDHASFVRRNIPAIFLFSGLHPEYHSPADDVDLINFDGLADVTEVALRLAKSMASAPRDELAFVQQQSGNEDRVRLGVMPGQADEGVALGRIVPDSPADRAGMEEGDVLIRLDGKDIGDFGDLRDVLGELTSTSRAEAVVRRDGEEKTLQVDFSPTTQP